MIAYAQNLTRPVTKPKFSFGENAQSCAVDEYRRAWLSTYDSAPHGSKLSQPKLRTLLNHMRDGENRMADTTMAVAFGLMRLGVPKSVIRRPFLIGDAIVSAQFPADSPLEIEDLNEIETKLQGEIDCLQVKLWRGDRSQKTLSDARERLVRMRTLIDGMLAWIDRRLYGEKHQQ